MTPKTAPHTRHSDTALFAHFFGDCDPYPAPMSDRPPETADPATIGRTVPRPAQPDVSAARPD